MYTDITETNQEVSSAIAHSSGYNRLGVENFALYRRQRTSSVELPHIVGSTSSSLVPLAASPESVNYEDSIHSVSSFGHQDAKRRRYYCNDCRQDADENCEENHVIQRLKKARERLASEELQGLEALLERRSSDVKVLSGLTTNVESCISENYNTFVILHSEVQSAFMQLKECINSECDAGLWEEARRRAQMLLARNSYVGQEVQELKEESVSLYLRTSKGNAWLANNVQMAQHPLALFTIIHLFRRGVFIEAPIEESQVANTLETESSQGSQAALPLTLSSIVKEEVEEKHSDDWQAEINHLPETEAASSSRCSPPPPPPPHMANPEPLPLPLPFPRPQIFAPERNMDWFCGDSLLLLPFGGRGQRLGRRGSRRTKGGGGMRSRGCGNTIFRPDLRGVARVAGNRKLLGLEYGNRVAKRVPVDSVDLTWLLTRGDDRRKKDAFLNSSDPVRVLTGVYCHKDSSFVSKMLLKHREHLEELVLYAARREHLSVAVEMPKLRKLDVWTCDRPSKPGLSFNTRTISNSLQWMELNLPRQMVRSLLRVVGHTLKDLLLWVGTGIETGLGLSFSMGNRDKWPSVCSTLDQFLMQCFPLPRLRTLLLMRNTQWNHTPSSCREQLASVRIVLPHVQVRCDICDASADCSNSQGTFSQVTQDNFALPKCDMEEEGSEDSDCSRPEL